MVVCNVIILHCKVIWNRIQAIVENNMAFTFIKIHLLFTIVAIIVEKAYLLLIVSIDISHDHVVKKISFAARLEIIGWTKVDNFIICIAIR